MLREGFFFHFKEEEEGGFCRIFFTFLEPVEETLPNACKKGRGEICISQLSSTSLASRVFPPIAQFSILQSKSGIR